MTDLIVIQPQVTELTVTEDVNQVVVSSVGVQGPKGDTGDTGPTGPAGGVSSIIAGTNITISPTSGLGDVTINSSGGGGTIAVTAPITNSGTPTSANIGIDLSNIALKYASPWQVNYRSGYYYESKTGGTITTAQFAKNRLTAVPLFISETITLDRIGAECTVAAASTTMRLGIYNSNSNGVPSSLILDAGTIDTSSIGQKTITINQTLNAGFYYLAFIHQGGTAVASMRAISNTGGNYSPIADTVMSTFAYFTSWLQDGITGSMPSTMNPSSSTTNTLRIQFRVA